MNIQGSVNRTMAAVAGATATMRLGAAKETEKELSVREHAQKIEENIYIARQQQAKRQAAAKKAAQKRQKNQFKATLKKKEGNAQQGLLKPNISLEMSRV